MNNKRPWIAILIIVICVTGYFLIQNLEKVEEIIDLGMSTKARRNPKLAAEMFIRQSGIKAEGHTNFKLLDRLPNTNHTLIITGQRKALSEYKYQKLWQWVEQGGFLITTVQTLYDEKSGNSDDPFLDKLGVRQFVTDTHRDHEEDSEVKESTEKNDSSENETDDPEVEIEKLKETIQKAIYNPMVPTCNNDIKSENLTQITFDNIPTPLDISFSTDYEMQDGKNKAVALEGSTYGIHFMQYEVGRGLITVMTDDWIWDNGDIQCYDHAYLLWLLTKGSDKVWFLYKTDSPSFMTLLIKNNHILFISFLLIISLMIMKNMVRFGPLIQIVDKSRRQLKEHIDASGMYFWRNNLGVEMVQGLRTQIGRRIRLYHRDYSHFSESEKSIYLAKICVMTPTEIEEALNKPEPFKENDFTRIIKNLQNIREHL